MARLERWITARHRRTPPTPTSGSCCTATPSGTCCAGCARRNGGAHATHDQVVAVQQHISAAIALLDWLTARDLTLATARQGDLDTWLASAQATHRTDAGNFVRWATQQKLTSLDFAATRWGGPAGVIDTEARWEQARRLLHDDTAQTRGPRRRAARPALRPMAGRDQPAHPRATSSQRRPGAAPARPRAHRAARTPRRPRPAARRHPPRPRRHRRPGHLALAVPRRAARPARSAPTSSPNDSASSASAPARPAPPRCSSSPPNCPPPSSPALLGIHINVAVAWQRACRRRLDHLRRRRQPPQPASPDTRKTPANPRPERHSDSSDT